MSGTSIGRTFRRARLAAGAIVGALGATGVVAAAVSPSGSIWRDLGLAVLSGAIVGGALVVVESLLAGAAEARGRRSDLLSLLATSNDFSGIDLEGEQFPSLYLPGRCFVAAHLAGILLDGAKLQFGDFRHSNLTAASLIGTDFGGSTLAYADLSDSQANGASFDDADLSNAVLARADCSRASFSEARLTGTSFAGADLSGSVIRGCYLEGADFSSANLDGAVFEHNQYDATTLWGRAHDEVPASVPVIQEPIGQMDLPTYLAWRSRMVR